MKSLVKPANIKAPIVVVLSSPDGQELKKGKAFVGDRAKTISQLFKKAGFKIEDLMFVHAYPTLRAGRTALTQKELDEYKDRVQGWITEHPRELLIPMGNSAAYTADVLQAPKGITGVQGRIREGVGGIKAVCTNDPYLFTREPQNEVGYLADLAIAKRSLTCTQDEILPPIKIKYIKSARDVKALYKRIKKGPERAASYDYETDALDPKKLTITSLAFCVGETKPGSGIYECWFYRNEKKLKKVRRKAEDMNIRNYLAKLFDKAGVTYDLIAHNGPFDDWVTYEQFPVKKFKGSTIDTMIEMWIENNATPNGLKEGARAIGYPDYDKEVDEFVKGVAARRGKELVDPLDFALLARHGYEPIEKVHKRTGVSTLKWPDKASLGDSGVKPPDKKLGAWAILPPKTLKIYNCYDVVMTWKIHFDWLLPVIQAEDLVDASAFRHRVARMLLRAERYGFLVDIKLNKAWSKQCKKIEKDILLKISNLLHKKGFEEEFVDNFNTNSNDHLKRVLFGEALEVPKIDVDILATDTCRQNNWAPEELDIFYIQGIVDSFHNHYYGDAKEIYDAVEDGTFNYKALAKDIKREFYNKHGVETTPVAGNIYYGGDYTPKVFTKTGQPSLTRVVLETMQTEAKKAKSKDDFLSLLMLYRRASKARSTFIDGIRVLADENNILRPHLNSIGTRTGRASSCVAKGTLVETPTGQVPIESLKRGDWVIGHDLKKHQCACDAYEKPATNLFRVTLFTGEVITCTAEHRFHTKSGWKKLRELSVGMNVERYFSFDSIAGKFTELSETFIDSIIDLGEGIPWDVGVMGSESYLAHGFVNHNSRPNGQNFIKHLRGQCIPRPGNVFVEFDLSQAEMRVVACLANDKELIAALRAADNADKSKRNKYDLKPDIHTMIAAKVFHLSWKDITPYMRKAAKTVAFGIVYGISARGLSIMLDIDIEEAQGHIDGFFASFQDVKAWIDKQHNDALKAPHYMRTAFGTRSSVKNATSKNISIANAAKRFAANAPVQGTAAEYTFWVLLEVERIAEERDIWCQLTNTTHDSGTYETAAENANALSDIIYEVVRGKAPFKILNRVEYVADVEITMNWSGEPSLLKALDPKIDDGETKLDWGLLDPTTLDPKERKELQELGIWQDAA